MKFVRAELVGRLSWKLVVRWAILMFVSWSSFLTLRIRLFVLILPLLVHLCVMWLSGPFGVDRFVDMVQVCPMELVLVILGIITDGYAIVGILLDLWSF